ITDAGLVGIVIGVSPHFSVLQLLLNRDTRVSSKVQRSRVDGIIEWEGETFLVLKNVPRSLDVQAGDAILTSTYSAKYPANIVVGRVTQVSEEANSLFRRVVVEPAVNFATLEQLFVVDAKPNPERTEIERKISDRLRLRTTP
ncbi:MAG: rod shape-determining protein MreC, partial [Candidatus Kapabacteria bacterium]|nr:rod shape-determining protein MreC [Candidatus Kapabacteria bacterium]